MLKTRDWSTFHMSELDVYFNYYNYMQNRAPRRARVQVPGHVLFTELQPIPDSYAVLR